MRIVQCIPNFGLGGIQKAGCVLGAHMAASGHDVTIVGEGGGPRMADTRHTNPSCVVVGRDDVRGLAATIRDVDPDVIHIHAAAYSVPLIVELLRIGVPGLRTGRTLLVSTPVFGRPPERGDLTAVTKTCCVGVYTLYRFSRWLGVAPHIAIRDFGAAYVPLTPFNPPAVPASATDEDHVVQRRRDDLGVPSDASIVVGRIGRKAVGKWHPATQQLVDTILESDARAAWLSVGLPNERGERLLRERWGSRFINFPETADYDSLTRVLSAMDVQVFFSAYGECFASSICEAAGSGVPTVALATPLNDNGQAEQVIDGVTGLLVNSIEGARQAVAGLAADRDLLTRLKHSTRAHAHENWHARRVSDDLLSLYDHWLGRGPTPSPTIDRMIAEAAAFHATYRERMITLMGGTSTWQRLDWRVRLSAAESWTVFRLARTVRRFQRTLAAPRC